MRPKLKEKDVEWVVNNLGELGVKIDDQFFFLYKGRSIDYSDDEIQSEANTNDDGTKMQWRYVGKREFGETCRPWDHVYRMTDPNYSFPNIKFPETYVGFHPEESQPDYDNPWKELT